MSYEIVSEDSTHVFAGVRNVLISYYRSAPGAQALRDRAPWAERMFTRYGIGGLLVVVDRDAKGTLPDAEFRRVSREQTTQFREHVAFSSVVIEGIGIERALLRTFLRGIAMVAGRSVSVQFFAGAAPGAAFAARRAGVEGPGAQQLLEILAEIRAR